MTLSKARAGERVTIRRVQGGEGLIHRLAAMGLLPGRELTVMRNAGSLIVRLRNDRYVVGRGMAQHIVVEAAADAAAGRPVHGRQPRT